MACDATDRQLSPQERRREGERETEEHHSEETEEWEDMGPWQTLGLRTSDVVLRGFLFEDTFSLWNAQIITSCSYRMHLRAGLLAMKSAS